MRLNDLDPELYVRMIRATPDAMVLCDARADDIPLVHANHAFEAMTGFHLDEVRGRNCRFLRSGQEPPELLERLRGCLENGRRDTFIMANRRRDGSLFWNQLTIIPLHDDSGTLTHFMGVLRDVTEMIELRQRMQEQSRELDLASRELVKLATRDTLTTVFNRRYFLKRLERECGHCLQHGCSIAVFNVDVDHFKRFNEYFGNQAGDECLQLIAHVLRTSFTRPNDVVARFSDVEFIVSASGMDESSSLQLAEAVRHRVRELNLRDADGGGISVSIGIAVGYPGELFTPDNLITCAAHELERAKRGGRNRASCVRLA